MEDVLEAVPGRGHLKEVLPNSDLGIKASEGVSGVLF